MCLLTSVGSKFKMQSGGVHRILNVGSVLESLLEATGPQFQRPSSRDYWDHLHDLCFLIYLILRWRNKMVCHPGKFRAGGVRSGSPPCASSTQTVVPLRFGRTRSVWEQKPMALSTNVLSWFCHSLLRAPSSLSHLSLLRHAHFHW